MIKEKGKRCGSDKTIAESRVEGDVDKLLTIKVPVDSDRIFDAGTFDNDRQVILVEGVGGMGKTSLAYQYAQKWAEGKLSTFDAVALVRLRELNEHDICEVDRILLHLLFLATGNSMIKRHGSTTVDKQKILLILDYESPAGVSTRLPQGELTLYAQYELSCEVKCYMCSVIIQLAMATSRIGQSCELFGILKAMSDHMT